MHPLAKLICELNKCDLVDVFGEGKKGGRSRSKSPFRSFRWKKTKSSTLEAIPASASDDESNIEKVKKGTLSSHSLGGVIKIRRKCFGGTSSRRMYLKVNLHCVMGVEDKCVTWIDLSGRSIAKLELEESQVQLHSSPEMILKGRW